MIREIIKKYWQSKHDTKSHPVRVEALIVEDKTDEADLLANLLKQQNVIVSRAENVGGALELLSKPVYYQIAFVDLGLPNGSGIEVVRRIKDARRMCHVVVMSGAIEKIPLVIGYGYVGILGKPYTVNSIAEILWKHRLPSNSY